MKNCSRYLFSVMFVLTCSANLSAQEISIGFRDSLKSEILNETRYIFIRLPENYNNSEKLYPVLYRLDGDKHLFVETVGTVERLVYHEEVISEMIVVLIENTNRGRGMWPVRSQTGPDNFQKFFDNELKPTINKKFRTNSTDILCGQSMSSAFVLYSFLTSPDSFDAWIACSAGFPGGEEFYYNLAGKNLNSELFNGKTIVMTNGLSDSYDPEQKI
ncbi:MAG: hypothetical protein JW833_06400, partial [Prolixibacteraceae bacterium]|nr:hypothetical protein [Prolixibacteraceae bacterium]